MYNCKASFHNFTNFRFYKCFFIIFVLSWTRQHEHIEKLNMQAAISASAHEDEFVKESLISLGKV